MTDIKELRRVKNMIIKNMSLEIYELKRLKDILENQKIYSQKHLKELYLILGLISKQFTNQKVLNVDTLINDLKVKCMTMKKKIRPLKDAIEDLLDMLIKELDDEELYKPQLTKIKNNLIVIKDLQNQIKISKKEQDFRKADKLKKQLLDIRGESYENIILPIKDIIETHKIKDLETKVEEVEKQKTKKKDLRKEQKKLIIDVINFIITYKSLDKFLYN